MVDIDKISKQDFEAYENVRRSGKINMCDRINGCILSGLDKETYTSVMTYYSELCDKYPEVTK